MSDESGEQVDLLDHGFVRLDGAMADDLSVVNGARVSFARRKTVMEEGDEALIRFLMRDRHGSPFEHNAFRFHIRCPIFVAREWFRHRIGCLTGDTVVTLVDRNGDASPLLAKTIDELWRLWRAGEDGQASPDSVARQVRLRVLDERTGAFTTGALAGVIDKGIQPVYELMLSDGKRLTLTENHRLLTDNGWRGMRDAVGLVGEGHRATMTRPCSLMTNGVVRERAAPAIAPRRRDVSPSDSPTEERAVLTAHPATVASIAYVGLRQTYDLSVAGAWHNFVANGVVVHNSFNEFSLRYAKATDDFYVPDPDDVRTQVGKPGAYSFEPVDAELAERTRARLRGVYDEAYAAYEELVEAGVARELARSVLPVGAYTQFYWTVNARSLMNFISLRNSEFAQLEIRRFAAAVEAIFAERMPVTHASFVENGRVAP